MITMLALMVLGQMGEPCYRVPRAGHSCGYRASGRSGADWAFFEAFPVGGAGTSGACSTTPPTGARGESLTFSRASAATCTRTAAGGLATTGIADGDLVSLSSNVARVEYDSAGTLGLLVEAQGINVLLRSDAPGNALWADVGTPTLTGSQTDPFGGTTGVTIEDNDGAAFEGRSIATTVSAATAYYMHCYVKAGTRAEARISLDGTTADITGLSTTTWSIVQVADASSSGVSIPVQILVGDAAADTGTVIWGGCDIKTGTYRTSVVPTAGAAVTRVAEAPTFTLPSFTLTAPWSIAATVTLPNGLPSNARLHGSLGPTGLATYATDSYLSAGTWVADGTQVTPNSYITAQTTTANATVRAATYHDGTNWAGCLNSACSTSARAWTSLALVTTYRPGQYSSASGVIDGIISRICISDTDAVRCR